MDALARTRVRAEPRYDYFITRTGFPNWWEWHYTWYDGAPSGAIHAYVSDTMSDDYPTVHEKNGTFAENSCLHVQQRMTGNTSRVVQWRGSYFQEYPAFKRAGELPDHYPVIIDSGICPDLLGPYLESKSPEREALQGLPFVKEFRTTLGMIRKPMQFLKQDWPRLATQYTRGKKFRKVSLGEVLTRTGFDKGSKLWLEAHYGWDPFFSDLQAIAEGLSSVHEDYERYKNGDPSWTSFSKSQKPTVVTSIDANTYDRTTYENTERHKVTGRYRYKPAGGTGSAMSLANFVAQRHGLSLSNLASAAWEVVPYSCVLDWVVPVGDALQKLKHTACNFDLDHISQHTYFTATELREDLFPNQGFTQLDVSQTLGWFPVWDAETKVYRRNYYNGEPEGFLPLGGKFTTTRVLTALSLIAQQLHLPLK